MESKEHRRNQVSAVLRFEMLMICAAACPGSPSSVFDNIIHMLTSDSPLYHLVKETVYPSNVDYHLA
jgi:hypothetical protein